MTAHLRQFVVLGDSISAGVGDPVGGLPAVSAFGPVAAALRRVHPGMAYTNLAERGLLIAGVRERQMGRALELRPELVSIVAGGNDILKGQWDAGRYEEHLDAMLAAFTGQHAQVITATFFNITSYLSLSAQRQVRLSDQLQEGNEITRRLSRRYGTLLMEFWEQGIDRERRFWSQDGVHPNALGYREVAAQLLVTLGQQPGLLGPGAPVGGRA